METPVMWPPRNKAHGNFAFCAKTYINNLLCSALRHLSISRHGIWTSRSLQGIVTYLRCALAWVSRETKLLRLWLQIFIPVWLNATANRSNECWNPFHVLRRFKKYQNVHKIETADPAAPNRNALVDSAVTVHPILIDHRPQTQTTLKTKWGYTV